MTASKPDNADPGLRIKQIDAEIVDLDRELKRVKDGTDEASSRSRAELNERIQQLKAEQNQLIKQQDAESD